MIVVQYILPTLRVAIARELIEKYGLKKIEIAEKMDVTPAAITQYLNRSRGDVASTVIEGSSEVMNLVSDLSHDLAHSESPVDKLLVKLCIACRRIRAERLICDLHKEAMPSLRQIESCVCSLGLVGWGQEQPKVD